MKVKEYFPGANTPEGFYSYYSEIFKNDEAENIIILKGGPGTGKSSLMKKIASHAAKRGYDTELLHCSSDPDSLDGVCIREKGFLILDGTSPHITDPKFPGAVDRIINLGQFWNEDKIRVSRKQIIRLSDEISHHFKEAYSYMKSASALQSRMMCDFETNKEIAEAEVEAAKQELGIKKINSEGLCRKGFLSAYTHSGKISYAESFAKNATQIIAVKKDRGNTCAYYMKAIADMLYKNGFSIRIFYSSMNPESEIEHIYLDNTDIFITTENITESKYICNKIIDFNTTSAPVTPEYENDTKLYDLIMQKSISSLKKAKLLHDDLEKYYIPHMNFSNIDNVYNEVCKNLI